MDNNFDRIFNYIVIPTLVATVVIFLVITRLVNYRTSEALKDYSMLPDNVEVVDNVILGRSYPGFRYLFSKHFNYGFGKLFRSGAIELVCTNDQDILLLVRGFMHKYASTGRSARGSLLISFRVEDGVKKGSIKFQQVTFLSRGYFDTIVSDYLSQLEINLIVKAIEVQKYSNIDFSTQDGVIYFHGKPKISKVKVLINKCQSSINT